MSTLDNVIQYQQEGWTDDQIIAQLKQDGISPREIEDSLSQSKIKEAVSEQPVQEEAQPQEEYQEQETYPEENYQGGTEGTYDPNQTQQYYEEPTYAGGGQSTETISEIAEQIVNEKLDKFQQRTGDLVKYQNEVNDKLADLDQRLKTIESGIEQLQRDIIKKIGEFGDSNALVHKDLENLHGTMSKMMNPLMDNYQELKKLNETQEPAVTKETTTKTIKKA